MKYESTLFWRYDPAAPTPEEREGTGAERAALAEILRCLPAEVCQLGSRFDGATDAGNALMNSSLALTRHINNLLNSWYLATPAQAPARGIAERKLVAFSLAPRLSYGKETEGLRTLLAAHASVAGDDWPELTEMAAAALPPECGLYKMAAKAIGETMVDMPGLQADYLGVMVARHIRANVLPSVTVLEFLGATVPLRNETTGHNLAFSPIAAAVVARYLAPALRAFLTHGPVRTAMTRVRIGKVVRLSTATRVEVELDCQGPGWPSEVFELDADPLRPGATPPALETRVVVRLSDQPTFAARYVEFPTPAGNPEEAEQKVRVEVLGYLLRDGAPPPTDDALRPLDGTGWAPTSRPEQEAYVVRASKPVIEAYIRWLIAMEARVPLTEADLSAADREWLGLADPELATLPVDGVLKRLQADVVAGCQARRRLVTRLLAEPTVSVSDIGRAVGDATLTLHTLRRMQDLNELASDIPWTLGVYPEAETVDSGRFSVWTLRTKIQGLFEQIKAVRERDDLKPGRPVEWGPARLLIEALRELVDGTLTQKDFTPLPTGEVTLSKEGVLAILDELLSVDANTPKLTPTTPAAPPLPPTTVRPESAPAPPERPQVSGLRMTIGRDDFRARGITGIYRELARAYSDRPHLLSRLADLAGPEALFATDRSLFYTAEQLAAGVSIRQPVRLQIAGRPLYFEGSISSEVGLLHLARLLNKGGTTDVVAWVDGVQVYPVHGVGSATQATEPEEPTELSIVYAGRVSGEPTEANGHSAGELLKELIGKILDDDANLRALDGLLPMENGRGADIRRYLLSRTAIHKDGTNFRSPLEISHPRAGVLYLETYLSHEAALEGAEHLLERFGLRRIRPVGERDATGPVLTQNMRS